MKASKRWQPKDKVIVPRQTNAFKRFINGVEVTIRQFEQGLVSDAPHATGFNDGAASRYIQGGNSTVVYRGLV